MAFLEQFSAGERDLIVSLPYRAGLWVSALDSTGGRQANEQETKALEAIIHRKGRGMFESAFVHEVMVDAITRRDEWKDWAHRLDSVVGDCEKAVVLIGKKLIRRDVDAYRQNIMHITVEVAKAFREFDLKESVLVRLWACIRLALDKMIGIARGEEYESEALLNISYEEDIALSKIAMSLGVGEQAGTVAEEIANVKS